MRSSKVALGRGTARRAARCRATRGRRGRPLRLEALEDRRLLVDITGTVTVVNLPTDVSASAVPVRGAMITMTGATGYADTGEDGSYEICSPQQATPGTTVTVTLTAEHMAGTTTAYQAVPLGQGGGAGAAYTVPVQFTVPASGTQPYLCNIVLDAAAASAQRDMARAFAAFSVAETFFDYAAQIGANVPTVSIVYPDPGHLHSGYFNNGIYVGSDAFGEKGSLPLSVGHELGHCIAENSAFGMDAGTTSVGDLDHRPMANHRCTMVPANTKLGYQDQAVAFEEGWAGYFAVAAATAFPAPTLHIPAMDALSRHHIIWGAATSEYLSVDGYGGHGEDDEWSITLILWHLANDQDMRQFCDGGVGLFQDVLQGSFISTLSGLWNNLVPDTTTTAGAARAVALGTMLAKNMVSPVIMPRASDQAAYKFSFVIPHLHTPTAYLDACTMDTATLQIYYRSGTSWQLATTSPIAIDLTTVGGPLAAVDNVQKGYTTFTYTILNANALAEISDPAKGTVRCWVVTAGAHVAGGPGTVTGQYWSRVGTFQVAGMNVQNFRSGIITNQATCNDPQLVYDIVVPPGDENTVTIPGFTIFVGAGSGVFGEPDATAGIYYVGYPQNAPDLPGICVIDATGTNDLTATASDFERTVTLPASALSATVIEGCWETAYNSYTITDPYLVASIEFDGAPNGNDNIPVRFEGGAFQTADGTVFVESSASLDDSTPDSNVANTITLASGVETLAVAGQGGTPWDPISYTETFSGAGTAYVFAHDGDDLVDARGTESPLTVDVEAADGDNTILGGGGGTLLVDAGDGNNTVSCGNVFAEVELGSGDNTVYDGSDNDQIGVQDGNNTFYLGTAAEESVNTGYGKNTYVVAMGGTGHTSIWDGDFSGDQGSTLVLQCTATSQLPDLGSLTFPDGCLGSPYGPRLDWYGIAGLSGLDFEGGGTCAAPSDANGLDITVGTGTTLDLGGQSYGFNSVTLAGNGIIQDGSIAAEAYFLESGTAQASLGGDGGVAVGGTLPYPPPLAERVLPPSPSPVTAGGGTTVGTVTLSGTNGYGGGTYIVGGTVTLSGDNTYTGGTAVNAGTLVLGPGGSLENTAISVANGATFAPAAGASAGTNDTGSSGATLSLASGATLNLADGTVGTFELNQQSGFGSSGTALTLSGATLDFDIGPTGSAQLVVNGGAAGVSGSNVIDISAASGAASLTPGTYTLLSVAGGGLSGGSFTLATPTVSAGGGTYYLSLGQSGGQLTVTVDAAPQVVGVYLSGRTWATGYLNALAAAGVGSATLGYRLADGAGQLAITYLLDSVNANRVSIVFSEPVSVAGASLVLGDSSNNGGPASGISVVGPPVMSAGGTVATWALSGPLTANKYFLSLAAAGVTDAAGTELDGDWTTGVSTFAAGSGNGVPGGNFNFGFAVLPGDANGDGVTAPYSDALLVFSNLGRDTAAIWRYDVDGNGYVQTPDALLYYNCPAVALQGVPDPIIPPP
jgi:autotransporter-associated beta strand protein